MKLITSLASKSKIIITLFSIIVATEAVANFNDENISVVFDQSSYNAGDISKIKVVVKKKPTNPAFQFIVEGTQNINGVISSLRFKQFNNIFMGMSLPLTNPSTLSIVVKFENVQRIKGIDSEVTFLIGKIKQLEIIYNETQDPQVLSQIKSIKRKINILNNERVRSSVTIHEAHKVMKMDDEGNEEEPDEDDEGAFSNIIVSSEGIDESIFNATQLAVKLKASSDLGFSLASESYSFIINGNQIEVN